MTTPERHTFLQGRAVVPFPNTMKRIAPPALPARAPLISDLRAELREQTTELRRWRLSVDRRQAEDTASKSFQRARALNHQSGNPYARAFPQHPEKKPSR